MKYYKNTFSVELKDIKNCTSMEEIENYIFSEEIADTDPIEISEEKVPNDSHFNGITTDYYNRKFLDFEMYWAEEDGNIYPKDFDVNLFEKVLIKPYNSNIELFWNNGHYSVDITREALEYYSTEGSIEDWRMDMYDTLMEQFKYINLFSDDIINECINTLEIYVDANID